MPYYAEGKENGAVHRFKSKSKTTACICNFIATHFYSASSRKLITNAPNLTTEDHKQIQWFLNAGEVEHTNNMMVMLLFEIKLAPEIMRG